MEYANTSIGMNIDKLDNLFKITVKKHRIPWLNQHCKNLQIIL